MTELLPCPFCGGTVIDPPARGIGYAACMNCEAYGPSANCQYQATEQDRIGDAITRWNTRATAAPVVVGEDMVERAYNAYCQRCWSRGETASGVTKDDMRAALTAALAGD